MSSIHDAKERLLATLQGKPCDRVPSYTQIPFACTILLLSQDRSMATPIMIIGANVILLIRNLCAEWKLNVIISSSGGHSA